MDDLHASKTFYCDAAGNRTQVFGYLASLRGHGHGRKLVLAAPGVRTEIAVLLDQPLGVVVGDEGADFLDGLEDSAMDALHPG
jgi:hypothetical protein